MLWHPAKWWYQRIQGIDFFWPTKDNSLQYYSEPPGLLDSGRYWVDPTTGDSLAPLYFQCLSCCCTPDKCGIPQEILMTLSGFGGTLSSIDRPSAFGYCAGNVCSECNILWTYSSENPGHRFVGYTAECCRCRAVEDFYWWPRNIEGQYADGGNMCSRDRPICAQFPHLCAGVNEPARTPGRIAARYINPCPSPCTDFVWSDYDVFPDYSLVELTDCAKAPEANARADYNCITKNKIDFVREADSYLWPPGFRGPGAVNLTPLCDGKFWNDRTYYRFCVKGGFLCEIDDYVNHCYCEYNYFGNGDFFQGLRNEHIRNDAWRDSNWCKNAENNCNGPVPIERVKWNYFRPRQVLISQPSVANCQLCPAYGFGYGSDYTNYGRGQDWYDPYDDGNCIGKTDVAMEDFNQTFMMYDAIVDDPPSLRTTVNRNRIRPVGESELIDAQLLYQCKQYIQGDPPCTCWGPKQGYWNLDYPCEPKSYEPVLCKCSICDLSAGVVMPKLQAFYQGGTGGNAVIEFRLQNYCTPLGLDGSGPSYNGFWWYVAAVFVSETEKGAEYVVGDKFVFDFYEWPLRGGEARVPTRFGVYLQEAVVTQVGPDGEILDIQLLQPEFDKCQSSSRFSFMPLVPLYGRYIPHRMAVGTPGNGYQEGDVFTFSPIGGAPEAAVPTGNRYYPYLRTAATYRKLAKATVVEVDSRGGVIDWYMCGARNTQPWYEQLKTEAERTCEEDNTGIYFTDFKYANRCEYNYTGHVPVRYAWSGIFDYHFHKGTHCEHAWAEFSFKVDQISVKNTVTVAGPPGGGKRALLKIDGVGEQSVFGVRIKELQYQNYERSPGPSAYATYFVGEGGGYFRSHDIPVPQGTVTRIKVVEPGSGYVRKVENPDGTFYWVPLEVSTAPGCGIFIRGVADDIRGDVAFAFGWGNAFCECRANIIMDEDSPNFGGIESIEILQGGLWYFKHEHDHVWFAQAGSNWYFELADPITPERPEPRWLDYSDVNGAQCWHASRDNWGEIQHFDGFCEPYPSGFHEADGGYYCDVIQPGVSNYAWPQSPQSMTGSPGSATAGLSSRRWSLSFCPNDLFARSFRMVLVHPCAACAKELGISGGQTCWNMFDSNTGTAIVDRLADQLYCNISLPTT
jgi:hypothetical protein